jgi:hypothetical protein
MLLAQRGLARAVLTGGSAAAKSSISTTARSSSALSSPGIGLGQRLAHSTRRPSI